MPRKSPPTEEIAQETNLAFEVALEKLEGLVREMESDQIPLEELIKNYEMGTELHRICEKRLDEAQGRIDLIRKKRNGELVLEPFGTLPDQDAKIINESGDSQDNGELF